MITKGEEAGRGRILEVCLLALSCCAWLYSYTMKLLLMFTIAIKCFNDQNCHPCGQSSMLFEGSKVHVNNCLIWVLYNVFIIVLNAEVFSGKDSEGNFFVGSNYE